MTYRVVEIFGPTLQGEGAMAGARTHFVRLGGCDFRCSWCDTPYAVLPEYKQTWGEMNTSDIEEALLGLAGPSRCGWVTLSGGNPALYDCGPLIDALHEVGYRVAMETQGTVAKEWMRRLDLLTLSPKPPSSGMEQTPAQLIACLNVMPERTAIKIVVFDDLDLKFANAVAEALTDVPVGWFLTPGTVQVQYPVPGILERTRWLVDEAANYPALVGACIIPQLHVLLWGTQRGV
jgi:7-carboxy-7-deazaguanine synthase